MPVEARLTRPLLDRGDLVFVDGLGVVQKTADEGRLAVIDAAGSGEAQHLLVEMRFEKLLELRRRLRRRLLIHDGGKGRH